MSSFHVDARVSVKLEYDFAVRLGEFLLQSGTEDKQILALGHKLNNLEEDEESQPVRFSNIVNKSYSRNFKKDYKDFNQSWEEDSNVEEPKPKMQIKRRATVR